MSFKKTCFEEGKCFYIGITLAILNSFVTALSNNLIKLAHTNEANGEKSKWKTKGMWVSGMVLLVVVNTALNFAALLFAPVVSLVVLCTWKYSLHITFYNLPLVFRDSVVSAFCILWLSVKFPPKLPNTSVGLSLAWNLILAVKLNGELAKFNPDGIATLVVMLGVTLCAVFGNHHGVYFTPEELFRVLTQRGVVSYFCFNMVLSIVLKLVGRCGCGVGPNWARFAAALLPAVLAGVSTVMLKCALLIFEGSVPFSHWRSWCVFVVALALPVVQLYSLNAALRDFDALFITPVYQSTLIISTAVGGIACFQPLSQFTTLQLVMFPVGVSVTAVGVYLLTMPREEEGEWSQAVRTREHTVMCAQENTRCHLLSNVLPLPTPHATFLLVCS